MTHIRILLPEEIDRLKELGNIGCGHAATALSNLTNLTVAMSVPNVSITVANKLPNISNLGPEKLVAFIKTKIKGDLNGLFTIIFPVKSAEELVKILLEHPIEKLDLLSEIESSLLIETGNIMCGSFVTALENMLGFKLEFEVPQLAMDMMQSSLESVTTELSVESDIIFTIHTEVFPTDKVIEQHILLMLNNESTLLLLDKLHAMVNS